MPILRDIVGSAFFQQKRNPNFNPNAPLGPDNLPYVDPGFGTKLFNPQGAAFAENANYQASLAPSERAAQMQDWQSRAQIAQTMQDAEKVKGLKERDLTIASVLKNNPSWASAFGNTQNASDLFNLGVDSPTKVAAEQGAGFDIANGVPALTSQRKASDANRELATNKSFMERLPVFQNLQNLQDKYNTLNTEGLIASLPAAQKLNELETTFKTWQTQGLINELPAVQRLAHINNLNAINNGLYNVPLTQQLERSQTQLGQDKADTLLANSDVTKRTLVNNLNNEEFRSQYPADITGLLEGQRNLATRGPNGYSLLHNTQYENPQLQQFRDMQEMTAALQGGGKAAVLGTALGLPKKTPAPISVGPTRAASARIGGGFSNSVPVETAPTATQAARNVEAGVAEKGILPMAKDAIIDEGKPIVSSAVNLAASYNQPVSTVGTDYADLATLAKAYLFGTGQSYLPISQRPESLEAARKQRDELKRQQEVITKRTKERPAIGKYNWQTGKFDPAK